jgi:hypothetical protein
MINHGRDPAMMTPDDRLAEIAAILAEGYLRIISKTESNCLDDLAESTAHCDHTVNGNGAGTREDAVA